MSTLKVVNLQHPSYTGNNVVLDSSGNMTVAGTVVGGSSFAMRNRIINGDMRIDQRNAGASLSVQTTTTHCLDRWAVLAAASSKYSIQQNAGSITPPAGFSNYLGVTVGASAGVTVGATDQYLIRHGIEGLNMSDLAWGTSSAKSVTLSFWVRSSVTGTFGGALDGGGGGSGYSYPFTYTISSANTWTYVSIIIPGQTSGTWTTDNTLFTWVVFSLGVGTTYSGTANTWANTYYANATGSVKLIETNSATWQITGVQLEVGNVATPFERRSYGHELMLCQRYYYKTFDQTVAPAQNTGNSNGALYGSSSATNISFSASMSFPVTMRAVPTITTYAPDAATANWSGQAGVIPTAAAIVAGTNGFVVRGTTSVLAGGQYAIHVTASIEL